MYTGPTITLDYPASSREYNLYLMPINEDANVLRNAICAYGAAHNHPDDAYLLSHGLLGAIIDNEPKVSLSQQEVDLIARVIEWANARIGAYLECNANEIREFEIDEGRMLSDAELLVYAIA